MPDVMKVNAAAVLYSAQTSDEKGVSSLVWQVKEEGVSLGGIIQEQLLNIGRGS